MVNATKVKYAKKTYIIHPIFGLYRAHAYFYICTSCFTEYSVIRQESIPSDTCVGSIQVFGCGDGQIWHLDTRGQIDKTVCFELNQYNFYLYIFYDFKNSTSITILC